MRRYEFRRDVVVAAVWLIVGLQTPGVALAQTSRLVSHDFATGADEVAESAASTSTPSHSNPHRGDGRPGALGQEATETDIAGELNSTLGGLGAGDGISGEVFGPTDDRQRVMDTTPYPTRAIVHYTYERRYTENCDGESPCWKPSRGCTGAMISARVVLTAAHCVHDGPDGVWRRAFVATPGRNGESAPYGSCNVVRGALWEGWTETEARDDDIALLLLDCDIGRRVGWFGLTAADSLNAGAQVVTSGYPVPRASDDPPPPGVIEQNIEHLRQYTSAGAVRAVLPTHLFYRNDTYHGMSGSPVVRASTPRQIIAVHISGPLSPSSHTAPWTENNFATRLTRERVQEILRWVGDAEASQQH